MGVIDSIVDISAVWQRNGFEGDNDAYRADEETLYTYSDDIAAAWTHGVGLNPHCCVAITMGSRFHCSQTTAETLTMRSPGRFKPAYRSLISLSSFRVPNGYELYLGPRPVASFRICSRLENI